MNSYRNNLVKRGADAILPFGLAAYLSISGMSCSQRTRDQDEYWQSRAIEQTKNIQMLNKDTDNDPTHRALLHIMDLDPVLQQIRRLEESFPDRRIPLGEYELEVTRYFGGNELDNGDFGDVEVTINLYRISGQEKKQIDLSPSNPLSKSRVLNLSHGDWNLGRILSHTSGLE